MNTDTDIHTHGECHVKMKAEMGVMQQKSRSTKDCQETTNSQETDGTNPTNTLVSDV